MSSRGISVNINHHLIGSLKEISFFVLLVLSSIICITSIVYFQSQFDLSSPTALYKEIAEDYHPSAVCDREGTIHVVWQSDREGNWDIYYTCIKDRYKKEFKNLTHNPHDDMFPSITEDEKGNILVIWVRSDSEKSSIYGRILESQSSLWGEEKELISKDKKDSTPAACDIRSPSLISMDSESMLLAWISREEKEYEIKYAIYDSTELSRKELPKTHYISSNNSKKVVLGKTKAGKIFALWDSMSTLRNELYYSFFNQVNRTFESSSYQLMSTEDTLFTGDTPSVVIRKGKPTILFFHGEDWNIYSSVESDEYASEFPKFSPPIAFSKTVALEDCPSALETNNGEIYLFWASNYTGDNEIYFCHISSQDDFEEDMVNYERDPRTIDEEKNRFEDMVNYERDPRTIDEEKNRFEDMVHYERGPRTIDEEKNRFVKNLTMDQNQDNVPPEKDFCKDIFLSVAVIEEEIWVVWDSYQWDITEENNRRQIKYMKTSSDEDEITWEQPVIVVDSKESNKIGRDDRHPTIVSAKDRIWLFWHSDRYRTKNSSNFEICYIYLKDGKWEWKGEHEDPYRLVENLANDTCPTACSIGDRIFVVWRREGESGSSNILFCEFDGKKCLKELPISNEDDPKPKWYPSIAAYKGWHVGSLGHMEELVIAWESIEKGHHICQLKTMNIPQDITNQEELDLDEFCTEKQQGIDFSFPTAIYVSRHPILRKILPNELWYVCQYKEVESRKFNIQCQSRNNEIPITNDLSLNERPQIVEFKGKVWIFWDSNGGGNERGIYFKCLKRREIPFWLTSYSYVLAVCWVLFLWDLRSKGGVRKRILEFSVWIDGLFHRHIGLRDVLIGVFASLLTYILLHFMGTFLNYISG